MEKNFNYGQIYVALSRVRFLQGQLENKHVRANPKVHAEYHRLRQQADTDCSFSPVNDDKNFKISLCLLNIRSLQKHSIDIKHDANLNKCDILALTETQLLPHHSDNIITEILHPYALHRQDHPTDKYSSLAICSKNNINLVQKQYFPSINGLICNALIANINKELKFLLTYRKNNSNTQQYLQNLNNILQTNTVDIILGDFNINYFNELLILPLKQLILILLFFFVKYDLILRYKARVNALKASRSSLEGIENKRWLQTVSIDNAWSNKNNQSINQ